ncbi:MAG: hypothetical protein ACREC5_03790 [Thermoplasmata archaeon]
MMPDQVPLRHGLVGDEPLARLAHGCRRLPTEGATREELERVRVRLALEWPEEGRARPGGFPFRLVSLEVTRRLEKAGAWSRALAPANGRRNEQVPEIGELRSRVERLLGRDGVRVPLGRLRAEVVLEEEIRSSMRAERSRRSREDSAPLTRTVVTEARRRIEEAASWFVSLEEGAEAIWEKVTRRFEAHAPHLCVEESGPETVIRSSVAS